MGKSVTQTTCSLYVSTTSPSTTHRPDLGHYNSIYIIAQSPTKASEFSLPTYNSKANPPATRLKKLQVLIVEAAPVNCVGVVPFLGMDEEIEVAAGAAVVKTPAAVAGAKEV